MKITTKDEIISNKYLEKRLIEIIEEHSVNRYLNLEACLASIVDKLNEDPFLSYEFKGIGRTIYVRTEIPRFVRIAQFRISRDKQVLYKALPIQKYIIQSYKLYFD